MKRLDEILNTMDVPISRRSDLSWLSRNLFVKNSHNPLFKEATEIIKELVLFQKMDKLKE